MVNLTRLMCGVRSSGDSLRYPERSGTQFGGVTPEVGPVVVWNLTAACNLRCVHCYYDAHHDVEAVNGETPCSPAELDTREAERLIDEFAAIRVPAILFSGGEPLMRRDIFRLIEYASGKGIRSVLSTNGTLIDEQMARALRRLHVAYVGVSLDGVGPPNDDFRGVSGAFDSALRGIRNCLEAGQRVGVRFTISKRNVASIERVIDLVKRERIPRLCFYHLVPSGRAARMNDLLLDPVQTRTLVEYLLDEAMRSCAEGAPVEILTVDNHADGVFAYLVARRHGLPQAPQILDLLKRNGGNRSGIAMCAIDHAGKVHADQFSHGHILGDVRQKPFSRLWLEPTDPLLTALRDRKPRLKGRCSRCTWLEVCNGNLRARAEALTGDFWASDPGCYLTEEEIA